MYTGKLVFVRLDHLPSMLFARCVARYGGNHKGSATSPRYPK